MSDILNKINATLKEDKEEDYFRELSIKVKTKILIKRYEINDTDARALENMLENEYDRGYWDGMAAGTTKEVEK